MKHIVTVCVLLLGSGISIQASAAGRLADIELIDRDTGQRLETHYRHGEYWVAGEPGAHYAISIRNRLGERVLAVTSVDGINVISGDSAGWDQGGYVFDPWESYQITGWRKSDYQVATFAFTAAPRSYAVRTGRPDNVGVIGIALFREQISSEARLPRVPWIAGSAAGAAPRSQPPAARAQQKDEASAPAASDSPVASDAPAGPDSPAARGAPASPDAPSLPVARLPFLSGNATAAAPLARSPALGTAHGEREDSYVAHTHFVRRHWRPDEIIRIRYDSLDNLIAMGIVRPHPSQGSRPNPFPSIDGEGYVPDPPPFDAALSR